MPRLQEIYDFILGSKINLKRELPPAKLKIRKARLRESFDALVKGPESKKFRFTLRSVGATDLENMLYHNTTDPLEEKYSLPNYNYQAIFNAFNEQGQYFKIFNQNDVEKFKAYFQVCKIVGDLIEKTNTSDDMQIALQAYKMLVIFGDDDKPEKYFHKIDEYLIEHNFTELKNPLHEALACQLDRYNGGDIGKWRELIYESGPEAVKLFNRAREIEDVTSDRGPPQDLASALACMAILAPTSGAGHAISSPFSHHLPTLETMGDLQELVIRLSKEAKSTEVEKEFLTQAVLKKIIHTSADACKFLDSFSSAEEREMAQRLLKPCEYLLFDAVVNHDLKTLERLHNELKIPLEIKSPASELSLVREAVVFGMKLDDVKVLQWIIQKGVNLEEKDQYGLTLLELAINNRSYPFCQQPIRSLIKANAPIGDLVFKVIEKDDDVLIKIIAENKESNFDFNRPNNEGLTLLQLAVAKGKAKAVKQLLASQKVDITKRDKNGCTLAFIAAQNGNTEIFKLLVEAKTDLTQANTSRDENGHALAFIAAKNGNAEIFKLLVEAKVDLNQAVTSRDENGHTLAFIAAQNGNAEIFKQLAEAKADLTEDINKRDKNGRSLAFIAAQNGNAEILKLLAEAKADLTQQNYFNCSPYDIAAYRKNQGVLDVLSEFKVTAPAAKEQKMPADYKALYGDAELITEYPKRKVRIIGPESLKAEKLRIDNNVQCDKFEAQFRVMLDKFKEWGKETKQGCNDDVYISRIEGLKTAFFNENYSGDQAPIFFNTIKQNMEKIWFILQFDKTVSDKKKIEEYKKLCHNMYVCAPGFYAHVEHALNNLTAKVAIDYWLAELRTVIINQYADQHVERFQVSPGFSPHVLTVFFIHALNEGWAPLSKITKEIEVFYDSSQSHIDKNTTFKDLTKYFEESYTPQAIADCVSTNVYLALRKLREDLNLKEEKGQGILATPEFINEVTKLISMFGMKAEDIGFFDFDENGLYSQFNADMFKAIFLRTCKENGAYFPKESWQEISLADGYKYHHCQHQAGWFEKEYKPYNIILNWKQPAEDITPAALLGKLVAQLPLSELTAIKNLRSVFNDGSDLANFLAAIPKENITPVLNNFFDTQAGDVPLKLALKKGDGKLINLLVEMKASIEPRGDWNPMHYAIEQGNLEGVKVLLELNPFYISSVVVKKSIPGEVTPFLAAIMHNRPEIAKLLLESKASLRDGGNSPIHLAASLGHAEMIKFLHDYKEDVNQLDRNGQAALYHAIKKKGDAAAMLLACKADPNIQDENGRTIVYQAVIYGNLKVLKLLAENKDIDFTRPNKEGLILLHLAVKHGFPDVVKELLNLNKVDDINKPDKYGRNAAFFAAQSGNANIVKILAEAKADFNRPNCLSCTPFDIAAYDNHEKVLGVLSELGIKRTPTRESKDNIVRDYKPLYGSEALVAEYPSGPETKELNVKRDHFKSQFDTLIAALVSWGKDMGIESDYWSRLAVISSGLFMGDGGRNWSPVYLTSIKENLENFFFLLKDDSSASINEKRTAFQLLCNKLEPSLVGDPAELSTHIQLKVNILRGIDKLDVDYCLAELRTTIINDFALKNNCSASACHLHAVKEGWSPLSMTTQEVVGRGVNTALDEEKLNSHFAASYTPQAIADCLVTKYSLALGLILEDLNLKEEKGKGIPVSHKFVDKVNKLNGKLKMDTVDFFNFNEDFSFVQFSPVMFKATFLNSCKENSTYFPKDSWREISLLDGYKFYSCQNQMGWFEQVAPGNNVVVKFINSDDYGSPARYLGTLVAQLPPEEFKSIKHYSNIINNSLDLADFISSIPKEKFHTIVDVFLGEQHLKEMIKWALRDRDNNLLDLLLAKKTRIDITPEWNPLEDAIWYKNLEVIKILLKHQPDLAHCSTLNKQKSAHEKIIFAAIRDNDPQVVKLLLDAKAGINDIDSGGRTPILSASFWGHADVIKVLYENNVNINQIDDMGDAALVYAARQKAVDAATVLLAYKADVNFKNFHGLTALHSTVIFPNYQIFIKLLEVKDIDINAQDADKRTSAHYIITQNQLEFLRELAKQPAVNFTIKDKDGVSPLDEAIKRERWSMLAYILMAMKPSMYLQLEAQAKDLLDKHAGEITDAYIAIIKQYNKDTPERSTTLDQVMQKQNLLGVILSKPPASLFAHTHAEESKSTMPTKCIQKIMKECYEQAPSLDVRPDKP